MQCPLEQIVSTHITRSAADTTKLNVPKSSSVKLESCCMLDIATDIQTFTPAEVQRKTVLLLKVQHPTHMEQ